MNNPFSNPFAGQVGDTVMPPNTDAPDQSFEPVAPALQPPVRPDRFNAGQVTNPYFQQAYAPQIRQQQQEDTRAARETQAAQVQARQDAKAAEMQAKQEEAQRITQQNSETLARYQAEDRPHYIDPATRLVMPKHPEDEWNRIKEQRQVNDQLRQQYWQQGRAFTFDREDPTHAIIPKQTDEDWQTTLEQRGVQHQINKIQAETTGNPDRAYLPDTKRAALEKQLAKDTRFAVDTNISPALTDQSKETSGGIWGFGASPTEKATTAKTRLDDLLKRSAGDPNDPDAMKKPVPLDEQDMADLQNANPELHARITAAQQTLAKDDENRAWHDEQKAKISSLKQRAADPAAWREAQLSTIASLTDPANAAQHLDRLHADYSTRLEDFKKRQQALASEQQAFDDHYADVTQRNEQAVTSGLAPDQIVTTADGKTWHKDLFNEAQQLAKQSQAWQAKRQPDFALLHADEKNLTAEGEILATAAKHTANLQEKQQNDERERLRLNPSFAPFVDQMNGLADEARQRQQTIAQYPEGSPERAAAEQALQADLDAKSSLITQGMNAKRSAGADLYTAVKGNVDDPELANKAHALGLNPTEARYWVNNFKAVDFNTGNKDDAVRQELDGTLHVNPSLWMDPAKAKAAIEASDATASAKKAAIDQLPQLEQEAYKAVVPMLAGKGFGFDQFAIEHHAAVLVPGLVNLKGMPNEAQDRADLLEKSDFKTEADLVKAFMAEHKTPAGWVKTQLQQALGGVLSGTVAIAQQGAAIAGAVTGSKDALALSSGINADMGALGKASSLMPSGQWTQQLAQGGMSILPAMIGGMGAGIVGRLAIAGRLASMEPAAAAALATKVIGRSSLAGSAGAAGLQTFGQTFGEAYDAYKAQDMTESEAQAKAWIPAIGSGLSTVIVTALGGREEWGGVESLTASAAGAKAKEAATGFLKGILKGAAGEFTEESIDQLVQGIIARKTYEPDKSWRDIAEESLQAGVLGAVLGGASHAVQHVDEHHAAAQEERWKAQQAAAADRVRKSPEAIAAADQQINGWFKEGLTPQQVRATQDVARAVVDVAHGNIAALPDGELQLLDLKREGGKIVEDPPENGRAARVTLDEQGNPIISQTTLDNLAREMPAVRALIGMDETTARHHFQTKADAAKATEATKNNEPSGGNTDENLRSQEGQRQGQGQQGLLRSKSDQTSNQAPGEPSPGALNRHRALTDAEQLRIEHLTNFLTDREVDPEHARTFSTAYVRDQGAAEPDTAIAGAKLVRWMQPFGGGVKARKQGNARAAEAVKSWLNSKPNEKPNGSPSVSETKPSEKPMGSEADSKNKPAALTELPGYMEARSSALAAVKGDNELQTGQMRKKAVKAITQLDQHINRYGALFPGGVRLATAERDEQMLNSTGGLWVDRAKGKTTLVVDLPAFLASHGSSADPRAIQATVEEELIHRVTLEQFTPKELVAFWNRIPEAIQRQVWAGYHAASIVDGETPATIPADLSDMRRENLAHEFLRMLVQDATMRERVTESLDIDPTFGQKVIEFLQRLAKSLRNLISKAPTEIKAEIQAYEAKTTKALKALMESLPANSPAGSSKAKLAAQSIHAGDLSASGKTVLGATTPADEGRQPHPIIKDAVTGHEGTAYTDQNEPIDYKWAVVEADDLVTSNHDNGSVNSNYPQEFQPRDRTSAGSQAQVQDIANNSNLDRLSHSNLVSDGAPIIGDDAVVESGNGRVLGLRRGYMQKRDSTEAYKQKLIARADTFGLAPDAVRKLKQPILVRLRTTPLTSEQRVTFSQAANVSTVAPMREAEVARKDAKNLTPEILALFNPDDEGNILSASNADFIRAFVRDVVPPAERSAAIDAAGNLSQSGVRRLRNALFVAAYGDGPAASGVLTKLAESTDDSGRNLVTGLTSAAPVFAEQKARMQSGALHSSLDITEDIIAAVAKLNDLKAEGTGVADYLAQDQIPGIGQDLPPVQRAILTFLDANQRSARKLKDTFARYQSAVEGAGDPRQGALFGDTVQDKTALWTLAATFEPLGTTPKRSLLGRIKALFGKAPASENQSEETAKPSESDAAGSKNQSEPKPQPFVVAYHAADATLPGDLSSAASPAETFDSIAKAVGEGSSGTTGTDGRNIDRRQQASASIGRWAAANGKLIQRDDLAGRVRQWIDAGTKLTSGNEHDVFLDPESQRVIKVTIDGDYGARGIEHYLANLKRTNAELGDDIQIVGAVQNKDSGWHHLVISQPFYKGRSATSKEISAHMQTLGYHRVADSTYYHPGTGDAISDAREANVIMGNDGRVHPFDVQFFTPSARIAEQMENVMNANPWGNTIGSAPKRSATLDGLDAVRAAKIYRRLFGLQQSGETLSSEQTRLMERAERRLGQQFMFDDVTFGKKPSETFTPQQPVASWDAHQLALFSAAKRSRKLIETNTSEEQSLGQGLTMLRTGGTARLKVITDVWSMLESTYAKIGNAYSSPTDLLHSERNTVFSVVRDSSGKARAYFIEKPTDYGNKLVSAGQDGTSEGKSIFKSQFLQWLDEPGNYAELSHGLEHWAEQAGKTKWESNIAAEIIGKQVEKSADPWHYTRAIGVLGVHSKILYGQPNHPANVWKRTETKTPSLNSSASLNNPASANTNASSSGKTSMPSPSDTLPTASNDSPLAAAKKRTQDSNQLGLFDFLSPAQVKQKLDQPSLFDHGNAGTTSIRHPRVGQPAKHPVGTPHNTGGYGELFTFENGTGQSGKPAGQSGSSGSSGSGQSGTTGDLFDARPDDTGSGDQSGGSRPSAESSRPGTGAKSGPLEPAKLTRPAPDSPERNYSGYPGFPSGARAKIAANLDAIQLLKQLESEGRNPTPDEKETLARYVGWGAFKEGFNKKNGEAYDNYWKGTEQWRRDAYMPDFLKSWVKNHYDTYQALKESMTPDEFAAAARSTLNAHFTDPSIIRSMWDMARQLGFRGGNVIEPAAGSGFFVANQPADLADATRWTAVELDDLTARLFSKLYPEATINERFSDPNREVMGLGFERARIPDHSLDFAISNVPFFETGPPDSRYPLALNLHNYFFARALDKVKPGGLVMFITSSSTMQNNIAQRKFLAGKGDLVAAYRLPNNAFKANAGTEVTTDILIMRKPDGNGFKGEAWQSLVEAGRQTVTMVQGKDQLADEFRRQAKATGNVISEKKRPDGKLTAEVDAPIMVNEYFANHPEHVLGMHALAGSMYKANEYTVESDGTLVPERLSELANSLPRLMGEGTTPTLDTQGNSIADYAEKPYSYVERDGKPWFVKADRTLEKPEWQDDASTVRLWKSWRKTADAVRALVRAENDPKMSDADIEPLRAKLNDVYDRHVADHGALTKRGRNAHAPFSDDPDFPLTAALEDEKKITDPNNPKKVKFLYKKALIFRERIIKPTAPPTTSSSAQDALHASLGWQSRIDVPWIAQLLGTDEASAKTQLLSLPNVFEDPASGMLEPMDRYLSGNVRQKLAAAEAAAIENPALQRNVEALRNAMPAHVPIGGLPLNLGERWIPASIYEAFAREVLQATNARFRYTPLGNEWSVNAYSRNAEFNTDHLNAGEIMSDLMNSREPMVYVGSGKDRAFSPSATALAKSTGAKIARAFEEFVRTSETMEGDKPIWQHVEDTFNSTQNNYVTPQYSGEHLAFPGLSEDVYRTPHRRAVIARFLSERHGMMAHGVGSGKTFNQIVLAQEMRRLGLAKAPMIVVQNSTLGQFAASYRRAYPNAKILVGDNSTFAKDKRREFVSRVVTGDYDAIILPHSQFALIPHKPDVLKRYIGDQIAELEDLIEQEKSEGANVRDLEGMKLRLEQRLQKMLDKLEARQDNTLFWEDLGIDALIIDEAHKFKSVPIVTRKTRIKGIPSGVDSQAGIGTLLKARSVQARTGGKNVFLATGTPIKNTMAEAYIMTMLASPHVLEDYGIRNFDDFANTYGREVSSTEISWGTQPKVESRFAKFIKGQQLITMIRSSFDVAMGNEKLGLKVPQIKGGAPEMVILPASDNMKAFNTFVRSVAKEFAATSASEREEKGYGAVPIMTLQAGIAAALDTRLISPAAADEANSKINETVRRVVQLYKAGKAHNSTQAIFSDLQKPFDLSYLWRFAIAKEIPLPFATSYDDKFNLYDDIKKKLIAAGIPAEEIAVVGANVTKEKRGAIFDAVDEGKIRVILGSTETIGVGANYQSRLKAVHHLMPPRDMTPAMMEQRNGRIIRQGNLHYDWNEPVEILNYGVEGTMDSAIYGTLARKQRFITQLLMGENISTEFDDPADPIAINMAEMAARTMGDPDFVRRVELEKILNEMRAERQGFLNERASKKRRLYLDQQFAEKHGPNALQGLVSLQAKYGNLFKRTAPAPEGVTADVSNKPIYTFGERTVDTAAKEGSKIVEPLDVWLAQMSVNLERRGRASEEATMQINGIPVTIRVDRTMPGQKTGGALVEPAPHAASGSFNGAASLISHLRDTVTSMGDDTANMAQKIEAAKASIASTEAALAKAPDYEREAEFQAAEQELQQVDARLAEKARPAPAATTTPAPPEATPIASTAKRSLVDEAAHEAATSPLNDRPQPTQAQKEAGNYAKGHTTISGLDISIENPAGSTRSGTDADGKPWSVEMQSHYGYIKGTEGKDGDHIDALIVPGTPHDYTGPVFIVNQHDPKTGQFDEHKVIIGAGSREQAERTYLANYEPGWQGLGSMVQRPMDAFKRWVAARRRIAPAKGADVSSNASITPTGRAQPMTEHVDTPSGPVMLGALVRGDKINAPDGTAQEIKAVHPQGKRPVFRVEVGHAKSALFDENHLFVVRLDTPTAPPLLMRLHEIAEAMNHHRAVYVPGLS